MVDKVVSSDMTSLRNFSQSPKVRRPSRIAPDGLDSFFSPKLTPCSTNDTNHSIPKLSHNYIPPWTEPYIIGIAGYSGSGKTSVAQKIIQQLNQPWTVLLSFDNFYNSLNEEERQRAFENEFDFDTPDSLDFELLVQVVNSLKNGSKTEIPVYSFSHHQRTTKTTTVYGANVIIIEGIYGLYSEDILNLMDLKIFVDTDLDVCLSRRLTRDILYRGRDLKGALKQWNKFVKPNAERYVKSTMHNADLIIPRGKDNTIAINMMIQHIRKQLSLKSSFHLKYLQSLGNNFQTNLDTPNIKQLKNSNQLKGIVSILLDKNTERSDFIFYFDRIGIVLINKALEFVSYEPQEITTPENYSMNTLRQKESIVAVSIIRSGDCFMNSIKKSFSEISIGKLLIQSDSLTGEPQLHTESLPKNIPLSNNKIILFDAQIISGAAAIMAVQVLIDHKIKSEDIIIVCFLCTEIGLRRILNAFSKVKVVIGKLSSMNSVSNESSSQEVEPVESKDLDSDWWFRTRFIDSFYFGT